MLLLLVEVLLLLLLLLAGALFMFRFAGVGGLCWRKLKIGKPGKGNAEATGAFSVLEPVLVVFVADDDDCGWEFKVGAAAPASIGPVAVVAFGGRLMYSFCDVSSPFRFLRQTGHVPCFN